jgi:hypothetical protein
MLKFDAQGCHSPSGNDACWRQLGWIFSGGACTNGYYVERGNGDPEDERMTKMMKG